MIKNITVAAVKKTKHGGYGRELARVVIQADVMDGFADERDIHARAMVELRKQLPGLKITTAIVNWEV
jgi:hypothetical protein